MPRRRGRPGLGRTMARTAVIAGTATAVSGGVRNRSANKQADQQAAAAQQQQAMVDQAAAQAAAQVNAQPAPAAQPEGDPTIAQIQKYADLHSAGVLTDEEFAAAKAKILGV